MADSISIYVGTYDDGDAANADHIAVRNLYADSIAQTCDTAVITKDAAGKIHVHAAETGAAVGALISLLYPPIMIGTAVAGEAAAGFVAHLWHGMSRDDLKGLGESLDAGAASLVVISNSAFAQEVAGALNGDDYEVMTLDMVDHESFERELLNLSIS
jgi:uncharacterized membrane protein